MAVWLTFWTASILIVLWRLGAAALRGEPGAAWFLALWLGFAALGLYAGVRRMQTLLGLAWPPAPPPGRMRHDWRDDAPGGRGWRDDAPGGRNWQDDAPGGRDG